MHFYWLTLGIFGVWRITHLLHAEDGPWNLLAKLRESLGNGVTGQLLDCFYCLSLWIAAPIAYLTGESWKERLLLWPALSGAAILLERISDRANSVPPAMYVEDPEREEEREEEKEQTNVLR